MNFIRREINEIVTHYSITTSLTWTRLFHHSWLLMRMKYGFNMAFLMWGVWLCVLVTWSLVPLSMVINRNSKFSLHVQPIVYFVMVLVEIMLTFVLYKIGVHVIEGAMREEIERRMYYHRGCELEEEVVQRFEGVIENGDVDVCGSNDGSDMISVGTKFVTDSLENPKRYLMKQKGKKILKMFFTK